MVFAKAKAFKSLTRDQKLLLLIKKEEDTINSVKNKSARLYYRYFELQNEKLKLIAKKENEKFIKQKSADRNVFFKNTKKQYFLLKKLAYGLYKIKNHKAYIAPTFHALSLSCRDYKFEKNELQYINTALYSAQKATELKYNIMVSKAEYLYNNKNYKDSYTLYKRITRNSEDQWYTKNLYNYGWTQFKTHKFDDAISSLESAYILSKKKQYIDFTEQVMNSLITFYISHSKIKKAVDFILTNDLQEPTESLLKLARKSSKKGFYEDTNAVIALLNTRISELKKSNYKKDEKNVYLEKIVELRVFELEHFKEFNKKNLFYKAVQNLEVFKLEPAYQEEAVDYITSEVSDLQQILKKGYNEQTKTYNKNILELCIYYFKRLRFYDNKAKFKYYYFAAETLFSVNEHKLSIPYYKNSISMQDEFTLNRKSIDALYIAIEEAELSKPIYYKNLEYVYSKVIKLWPNAPDTMKVVTNLFNLYLTLKDHKKMSISLDIYRKNFPKEVDSQKKLFEKQVDLLIKQSDTQLLSKKLRLIKSGYLSFSKDRIVQIEDILSTILFNRFKKLRLKGDDIAALEGYKSVYMKRDLPKKIKSQAALNIAIIYTDLQDSNNTLRWINRSFKQDSNIYYKNVEAFLVLADRTLLFQNFQGASNLYRYYLGKSCNKFKRNNDVMNKMITANMANNYTRKTLHYFKKYSECISQQDSSALQKEVITYLVDDNDYKNTIDQLATSTFNEDEKFQILEGLYWRNSEESKILSAIAKINSPLVKTFEEARLALINLKVLTKNIEVQKVVFTKEMKPEAFNENLNSFFTLVSEHLDKSNKVTEFKNKYFSEEALNLTKTVLQSAHDKIKKIKSPILDDNFNKSFYGQMNTLANGFKSQKDTYNQTLLSFKNEYNVLTTKVLFPILTRSPSSIKTIDLEKE